VAFNPPTFNLSASVWRTRGVGGAYAAPDVTLPCNLSFGRRSMESNNFSSLSGTLVQAMELLVPKRSDIRAAWNGVLEDLVEVPAGSGRFYLVAYVDDVGRSFLNEYRLALIWYQNSGTTAFGAGLHPAPVPLP
jgi:hypothetical protein